MDENAADKEGFETDIASLAQWVQAQREKPLPKPDMVAEYLARFMATEALNGDESFGRGVVLRLFLRTVQGRLDIEDSAVLAAILRRLLASPDSIKAICGVAGRTGQHRRGFTGLQIAGEMAAYLREHGSSKAAAATKIGQRHSLSKATVLGHWRKHLPTLLAAYHEPATKQFPGADKAEIEAFARVVVLGEKGAKPADIALIQGLTNRPSAPRK